MIGAIDERLEEAARNLGATALRAFVEVTLPLSLPGIFAGSLLVFAYVLLLDAREQRTRNGRAHHHQRDDRDYERHAPLIVQTVLHGESESRDNMGRGQVACPRPTSYRQLRCSQ